MEIARNLHWIQGRLSNIYLWTGGSDLLLIDTGFIGDVKKIRRYLHHIGRRPSDVKSIFITHADIDHAWSASALAAECKATVFAGEMTTKHLEKGNVPDHMSRVAQSIQNIMFRSRSISRDCIWSVRDGEAIDEEAQWLALSTPGHSPDHFSLFSPIHGILFTGDALNTRGDVLNLSEERISADIAEMRQTAMRLLRLHPAVIACGHGQPSVVHSAEDLMTLYRQVQAQVA